MGTGRRDLDKAVVDDVAEVRSEAKGQISGRRLKTGDGIKKKPAKKFHIYPLNITDFAIIT
jgi:hypothetical protein